MYENLTDKKVIVDCGKELNRDGKWDAMAIKSNSISISNRWTEWYRQTYHKSSQDNWTLVEWNRKVERIND